MKWVIVSVNLILALVLGNVFIRIYTYIYHQASHVVRMSIENIIIFFI